MSLKEDIVNYVAKEFAVEPEHLWEKFPRYAVLRHSGSKKWFGIIMNVPKEKLGLAG